MCEYESSDEVSVMEIEQRDSVVGTLECDNQNWEDYMKKGKHFRFHRMKS
jgi:hypothetical protein